MVSCSCHMNQGGHGSKIVNIGLADRIRKNAGWNLNHGWLAIVVVFVYHRIAGFLMVIPYTTYTGFGNEGAHHKPH